MSYQIWQWKQRLYQCMKAFMGESPIQQIWDFPWFSVAMFDYRRVYGIHCRKSPCRHFWFQGTPSWPLATIWPRSSCLGFFCLLQHQHKNLGEEATNVATLSITEKTIERCKQPCVCQKLEKQLNQSFNMLCLPSSPEHTAEVTFQVCTSQVVYPSASSYLEVCNFRTERVSIPKNWKFPIMGVPPKIIQVLSLAAASL